MPESASILVGKKPVLNYVMACLTLFYSGAKEVIIKARGRAISKAVSVAEALRRGFLTDIKIKNINIGTEQVQPKDRPTPVNVSTIEITLTR
ncbi:MAG: DNA-binding protein Alba [Candidatus Bathyarchaeia archaeon]|nr:DNA-binding protein Alba [Candidatus Bathyarchaeota archaeon]